MSSHPVFAAMRAAKAEVVAASLDALVAGRADPALTMD
jgi:hypothetical protein